MRPPGSYKLARRCQASPSLLDELAPDEGRTQRIVDSLREQISAGTADLRIRQIFERPREIFRVEINLPEMNYQRTTLLDREALEELLEADEVREAFLKTAP
jgi:hypothetical protein